MGACEFQQVAAGNDEHDAYRAAVEEAEYEYGHDAYNGTISTTSGCVLRTEVKDPTRIQETVDLLIDDCEKWEAAHAIELVGDARKKMLKRYPDKSTRVFVFFGWAAE